MKGTKLIAIIVGAVLLVAFLLFSTTYSVPFFEAAVITTFGEADVESAVETEPGLHFKLPAPIQAVKLYDRRLQLVDTRLETQATRDGRQVLVQAFVFWRIDDTPQGVLNFDGAHGSIDKARDEIEVRMRSAISALSQFNFDELIGDDNRLADAEQRIQERLVAGGPGTQALSDGGIHIEKVGLSQVMLPVETTQAVIGRMEKEREILAQAAREQGSAAAQAIRSRGRGDAEKIMGFADRLANDIRKEGDALATQAVMDMSQEPALAKLIIWLDALEKIASHQSTYFLPTTLAPFHLLDLINPQYDISGPVPVPRESWAQDPRGPGEAVASDGRSGAPAAASPSSGDKSSTDQSQKQSSPPADSDGQGN